MGAVTKAAKQLSQPQIVYMPSQTTTPSGPTPEELAEEQRRKNLLGRDRGRFGTVQTGFRGLLSLAMPFGERKTLLGE